MPEMFNRILRAFGANRIAVTSTSEQYIEFSVIGWSDFILLEDSEGHRVKEAHKDNTTPNAKWLTAIAGGMKRDDDGRVA